MPPALPSLRWVLDLEVVRRGGPVVVAGAAGLDRPVRWLHSAEVADIAHLLAGGELVLTTGIGLPGDSRGLERFIAELAEVRAAGVILELGRRWDAVPPALIRAAERAVLPLVSLARGIPFVRVTEAVHAAIVNSQLAELQASERAHRVFTDLTVTGADPAEVVRQVARMAGSPAVLETVAHQVLACESLGTRAEEVLADWERRSRRVHGTGTVYDSASGWLVTDVGARGRDWGRLVLLTDHEPGPLPRMVIERGATTLALHRLLEADKEGLERQAHRSVLAGILDHRYASPAEVAARAGALGVSLAGRRLVGVVVRSREEVRPDSLDGQAAVQAMVEAAAEATRAAGLEALVGTVRGRCAGLLVPLGSGDHPETMLDRLADAIGARAGDAGDAGLVVGAGSTVPSVAEARRSLLEAEQVAAAAARSPAGRRRWHRLADVRLRGLVELLRDDERLQTFTERELGALLAHDAGTHGRAPSYRLVPILRTYLDQGRNKSLAAAAAHLSRPAFYERLRKVEVILGVDLDDAESCLSLHLALLAQDALAPAPGI
jgi:purine catabolism regulator